MMDGTETNSHCPLFRGGYIEHKESNFNSDSNSNVALALIYRSYLGFVSIFPVKSLDAT